jgi:hypothetical protein
MMNVLAKSLVLMHVVLSLAGLTWALMLFLHGRDFGWKEPGMEVLEYNTDGTPSTKPGAVLRFASDYDKSVVAVQEAGATRDRAYRHVKPALESIARTENYLPDNHLFYWKEMERLRKERSDEEKKDNMGFRVKRLKEAGHALNADEDGLRLGTPIFDDDEVALIKKPYDEYKADLTVLFKRIDKYNNEIREIADKTQAITEDLNGTNKLGKSVKPGLYALNDLEFQYQKQLKIEIDDIKPFWSKAIEQAGSHRYRRIDLERRLMELKAPPLPKVEKKL